MSSIKRTKCRHCERLFIPDARNKGRQKYCRRPGCRKASKVASQQNWLSKDENKNYFKGPENVLRVQEWRKNNPGYWRKKSRRAKNALQEPLNEQPLERKENNGQNATFALQDSLIMQPAVLIGLISNITGLALQDDIAATLLGLQQLGSDILYYSPQTKGGSHDCQKPDFIPTSAPDTRKLQLDRPSPRPGPAP